MSAGGAHAAIVAAGAFGFRGNRRQMILAERQGGTGDFLFHVGDKLAIHSARLAFALIQLVNLNKVGGFAGQFLVTERVDVELVFGDFLGLGAVIRFEVNDGGFVGVLAANEVNPTGDADAVLQTDINLLFGKFNLVEILGVVVDVIADDFFRRRLHAGL